MFTWNEFQEEFFDRWRISMFKKVENIVEPFSLYTDYMSGPPRDDSDHVEWRKLCKKYSAFVGVSPYLNLINYDKVTEFPKIIIDPRGNADEMNEIIITNYRDYFDIIIEASMPGIEAFEEFRKFLRNKHGRD